MKKLLVLLLALCMVFAFAACAPTDDSVVDENQNGEEVSATVEALYAAFDQAMNDQIGPMPAEFADLKVGALIISLTNSFWANMSDCYKAAGENMGIEIDVQTGTTEGDTASQLDTLMTMADMDYDVIIVSPIDGTNLIPGIVKCNENGVKVINLGPGVDVDALTAAGGWLDAKITVAFEEQGETVANDMIARMPEGGQVAILAGLAGAGQSEGRTNGAKAVFEAAEGIELTGVINCDWDATLAYDATKDLLTEYPELKGIFACNESVHFPFHIVKGFPQSKAAIQIDAAGCGHRIEGCADRGNIRKDNGAVGTLFCR